MTLLDIQIAHFHPLLVHLPIGTIMLAFALELYNRWKLQNSGDDLISFALGLSAITALVSLGTGWLLGENGGFDEDLLFLHRWMAVAFTATTVILFFLKRAKKKWLANLYMPFFVIALLLISITGHYGGSMTHGEGYLFADTSTEQIAIKDIAEANVHVDIIQPILDRKCVSCHNQNKIKGGLLLNNQKGIIAGGDSGNIFDTVHTKYPLILHQIKLPIEDEEHMPPKGKVQLTPEEIALMEWWIVNSHCFDCKVKSLKASKKLDAILANLEEDDSPRAIIAKNMDPISEENMVQLNNAGLKVYVLAENNPLVVANLFGKKEGLENDLEILEDYAENIVELNLANSQFNDTIAQRITPFENVTKLQLQNTSFSDQSLAILKKFKNLESLNLYGTMVSDEIFTIARDLPQLKKLYVWQTEVTETAQADFQSDFPNIEIQQIPKDAFIANYISEPTIIAKTNFFKESLEVELESIFDGVEIFYTLDKSVPDATSMRYEKPFMITESSTVTAIATKEGWEPSELSAKSFKKSSFDYDNVVLNKSPNDKYAGQKGSTLVDLKRGSTNFVDGNWLGYEGSHFTATLALSENKEISVVSVGALSAPSSWIFYPRGFTIRTSEDGVNFKQVKSTTLPKEKPNADVALHFFDIDIPKTKAKFVQVVIKSPLKNPDWHPNPGGKSWIFIDEIVLN